VSSRAWTPEGKSTHYQRRRTANSKHTPPHALPITIDAGNVSHGIPSREKAILKVVLVTCCRLECGEITVQGGTNLVLQRASLFLRRSTPANLVQTKRSDEQRLRPSLARDLGVGLSSGCLAMFRTCTKGIGGRLLTGFDNSLHFSRINDPHASMLRSCSP